MLRLSGVVRLVLTIDTAVTVPEYPWASMKSPALKGLNASIIMPPAKFCTVPLKAMPMAIPPAASSAAIEVVLMPRVPIVMIISTTVSVIETRLATNDTSVLSAFLRSKPLTIIRRMRLMSQAPTM